MSAPGRYKFQGGARPAGRSAFTLIEVLVTLLLMAIVIPTVLQAVSSVTHFASETRQRSDAAQLAAAKLEELLAEQTGAQEQNVGDQSGDFSDEGHPDIQWSSQSGNWQPTQSNLNQTQATVYTIDLTVTWKDGAQNRSLTLSSLVYANNNPPSPYNNPSGNAVAGGGAAGGGAAGGGAPARGSGGKSGGGSSGGSGRTGGR